MELLMKMLKTLFLFSGLLSLSLGAQEIKQVKGKRFIFIKEDSASYSKGQKVKFYDEFGKVTLVAQIQKCSSSKCMAVMLKRRKGFNLGTGQMIYSEKSSSTSKPAKVASSVESTTLPKKYKYAIKGGLGGQNSASLFGEFDYIASEKWVYGLSVSNRIMSRDDLEVSGLGFGGRVDYHFDPFSENGFLASVNLGMVSLTYTVMDIEGVSNFEESESVPYLTLMGGYQMWFNNLYMTFAGGLSYMGYKESFEDPNSTASFTNPYSSMDLALEVSLSYPF